MTTKTPETPACPDPFLYAIEVFKPDRRRKDGFRPVTAFFHRFPTDREALLWATAREGDDYPGCVVRFQPYWVLRRNFLSGLPYWEEWNTPHSCSPSSETYHSM